MSQPNPADTIKDYKVTVGGQDVSQLIKKVSIQQSIHEQFMTCIIEYQDSRGIFQESMSGQDVAVSITPTSGAPLNCKFVLDNIDHAEVSVSGYHTGGVIRCVSHEYLEAKNQAVTKAYDKTSGEAVQNVYKEYYKTQKKVDADKGAKLPSVVLANHQKPHEVIEKLGRYEDEPYYSYETPTGFKWKKKSSLGKETKQFKMDKTAIADSSKAWSNTRYILHAAFKSSGQSGITNEKGKDKAIDPVRDTIKDTQQAKQAKFPGGLLGPTNTKEQKFQKPVYNTPEQEDAKRKYKRPNSQQVPEQGTVATLMLPANFDLEAGQSLQADLGPVGTGYTQGSGKNPWSNKYNVEKVNHVLVADGSDVYVRTFVTGIGMN